MGVEPLFKAWGGGDCKKVHRSKKHKKKERNGIRGGKNVEKGKKSHVRKKILGRRVVEGKKLGGKKNKESA